MERSQTGGNASPDPWKGWSGQAHPDAPVGGGGAGRFKTAGALGTGNSLGDWRGTPHPLAPAARYLAVAEPYCELGAYPFVQVEEYRGVYFLSLTSRAAMRPFLRTTVQGFQATVKQMAAKSRLAVVINANQYADNTPDSALGRFALKVQGRLNMPMSPSDPKNIVPQGIVRGRDQQLAGDERDGLWYVAWSEGPLGGYVFGSGNPPDDSTSAVGGLGPLIIGRMRYGARNKYRTGVPDGAPEFGDPPAPFKAYQEVQSAKMYRTYSEKTGRTGGKVALGVGTGERPLKIVVQRHGVEGLTVDEIRDRLYQDGVANAVFMDGSDSAMLFANGRFYVQQGTYKDSTTTVGIGFQVPCSYIDPPGRSLGNIA